jgi:formamidopyrimidine-DNA glycosylase
VPELPEVEVLVRHLRPLLCGRRVRAVRVFRPKIVAPDSPRQFAHRLDGAAFRDISRRGKYLVFSLKGRVGRPGITLVGHLGMTGRMYLQPTGQELARHTAVSIELGAQTFVFEDTRYFGRLTLNASCIERLGPEPLAADFTPAQLAAALSRSSQPIKVRLLDQEMVAGVGNIYASEALFRAGIRPTLPARKVKPAKIDQLWSAIREVLSESIEWGSTVPLNFAGRGKSDGLFYFGGAPGSGDYYHERLQVYDRKGEACNRCGAGIRRLVQGGRSTYFCPQCQPAR